MTPERSSILSLMLDEVSGTEINIQQEFCKVQDCIVSCDLNKGSYYTDSKAEGLNLPGSNHDYMCDINDQFNIQVAQTEQETREMSSPCISTLLLCTDGVHPGFALLRWLSSIPPFLLASLKILTAYHTLVHDGAFGDGLCCMSQQC